MRNRIFTSLILLSVLCGCSTNSASSSPLLQKPAPNFSLLSLDGKPQSLAAQRGHVVVLDFWATWCAPCRQRLAEVQQIAGDPRYGKAGLVVWTINEGEDPPTIRDFLANSKLNLAVLLDADHSVGAEYGAQTIPLTLIIGTDGVVRNAFRDGATLDQIRKAIDAAYNNSFD